MRRYTEAKPTAGAGGDSQLPVWTGVLIIAAAMALTGCVDDPADRDLDPDDGEVEEVDLDVDLDMVDTIGELDGYSRPDYTGQRNPFRPDTEVLELDEDDDDDVAEVGPTDPLEQYDLNELDLVTIISQTAVPRAMFIAPGGMGHFANEGDGVGSDGGVISDIRPDEVEIREGSGEDAVVTTVQLRERELRAEDDGELSEEERRMLQELLETEEGRQQLSDEDDDLDERLRGLAPPGQE